ncbi:hypothetical protein Tco_0828185, partial [Tanacetum coccineum]
MVLCFIMNLYVLFGISFDPKRYYKDGDCAIMLRRPRYQGLEYSDADTADFEERLERIYDQEIHRVQVVDFLGMPELMRDVLFARMRMEHRDDVDVVLGGARRRLSWRQFILVLGLHIEEMESPSFARYWSESERMILGKGDLHNYWRDISTDGDFLGPPASYTLIRDLVLRLCHQMMAHSIARRSQAPEKVTLTDLFYLRGIDVGSFNIPYLLARYLRRFAAGRKSGAHISGGQFVARLAEHFGLLTAEILGGLTVIAPELLIIDMAELSDAAAGAPVVIKDAPTADEGNQAGLAPVQAPQQPPPPPPAITRTKPQKMARLEEDVHEIHGALTKHREVINTMARDFSRFCTWTTTSLARMMNKVGVTYTSYYETPREYTRHVRCKTDGASTSTAQQD